MTVLASILRHLEDRGVPAAVIGGMALAAHGISRATNDTDLLLTDLRVLTSNFWADWNESSIPEIRVGDADDPLAGVVHVCAGTEAIDLVVGRERWMTDALARSTRIITAEGPLPVIDAADLILLKLYAAGPQDLIDIRLLVASNPDLRERVVDHLRSLPKSLQSTWEQLKI